jgi:peptide/nickel transport system ATP-binding protein
MCELRGKEMTAELKESTLSGPEERETGKAFLEARNVTKRFSLHKRGFWARFLSHRKGGNSDQRGRFVSAVDDVSLTVSRGETLVLLGESGSGKTTLGRLMVGLERLNEGKIFLEGNVVGYIRDRSSERGKLQMVFQDPGSSLDPYLSVAESVREPISRLHESKSSANTKVRECLGLVGLDANTVISRRTSDLSGGQKQRVAIARAIISEPQVIILDEPTSSIDVSIQAQVLNLLIDLQKMRNLTYVLITHDPNVARFMGDYIAVMHLGKIVEYGKPEGLLNNPKHPYTKALLASAPKLGEPLPAFAAVSADPQSVIVLPEGCRYEPRCPFAMARCKEREPKLLPLSEEPTSQVSCFLYQE